MSLRSFLSAIPEMSIINILVLSLLFLECIPRVALLHLFVLVQWDSLSSARKELSN